MRHVLVIALCAIFPCVALSAPADSSSTVGSRPNSLRAGVWAIQFTVVGAFSGGGAFVKRQSSPGHAFRLGAEFSLESRSGDTTEDTTSVVVEKESIDNDQFSVNVELLSQHYLNPQAPAQVYLCLGPFLTYSEYRNERHTVLGESRTDNNHSETWRAGGKFIVGGEWFASRSLSLAVEYGVRAGYVSTEEDYVTQYETGPVLHSKRDQSVWFTDGGDSRFALGIYF